MDATKRRQYEMLLRVRNFGHTYRPHFSPAGVAQQIFTTVGTLIDELTAADMREMSAAVSARAHRKLAARRTLADLLAKSAQLGRLLRERGRTTPPLQLPRSRSDQALLTAGRQFAREAADLEADFTAYGMPPKVLADTTAAFEAAVRDRGMSRADRTAAGTRIEELIELALNEVRRLDLVVGNELAGDRVVQAVWKQARHTEQGRSTLPPEPAPAPSPANEDAAPPQPA